MPVRRNKRRNGYLGRGLLASLLLHGQVILPLVILALVYGKRESNEVDLSFESVKEDELPAGLPTVEEPVPPEKAPAQQSAAEAGASGEKTGARNRNPSARKDATHSQAAGEASRATSTS